MSRTIGRVLGFFLLLLMSSSIICTSIVFAVPPLPDGNAKKYIEDWLNKREFLYAPTGIIRTVVYSDHADPKNKYFSHNQIKIFERMGSIGLISITEVSCGIGSQCYGVDITEKGRKASTRTDDLGFYWFKLGEIRIYKIVKNIEYNNPQEPTEEFRLILCIGNYSSTNTGKEYIGAKGIKVAEQYKYKILLKYDPFKKEYVVVSGDWGYLEKNTYETNNIK